MSVSDAEAQFGVRVRSGENLREREKQKIREDRITAEIKVCSSFQNNYNKKSFTDWPD